MTDEPTSANPSPEPVQGIRSFSLNSDEAYAALCPPPDPHVWGPRLPRDPRSLEQEVIVERSTERSDAGRNGRRSSAERC